MNRSTSLDIMRLIGLFCIILAHVAPPSLVFEIRNFDVPFMVIVSGFLFSLTNQNTSQTIGGMDYIKKRFIRLVLPVWVFLSLFFIVIWATTSVGKVAFPYHWTKLLDSYLLWGGIGYVWIIRVYFMIALFGPWFVQKLERVSFKIPFLLLLFVLYEFMWRVFDAYYHFPLRQTLSETVFYLVPYLLFFAFGAYFKHLSAQMLNGLMFGAIVLLMLGEAMTYYQSNVHLLFSKYKYPPSSFYAGYSLLISIVLLRNAHRYDSVKSEFLGKILAFIGSSTMWIYLWHIPIVIEFHKKMPQTHWGIKFLVIVSIASVITLLQQKIVALYFKKSNLTKERQQLIKTIFCS